MSAAEQPPYCPECGLHHPCKTCGGGGKPKLGLVATPAERLYTRAEVLAATRKAFDAGFQMLRAAPPPREELLSQFLSAQLGDL